MLPLAKENLELPQLEEARMGFSLKINLLTPLFQTSDLQSYPVCSNFYGSPRKVMSDSRGRESKRGYQKMEATVLFPIISHNPHYSDILHSLKGSH